MELLFKTYILKRTHLRNKCCGWSLYWMMDVIRAGQSVWSPNDSTYAFSFSFTSAALFSFISFSISTVENQRNKRFQNIENWCSYDSKKVLVHWRSCDIFSHLVCCVTVRIRSENMSYSLLFLEAAVQKFQYEDAKTAKAQAVRLLVFW